MRKREGNRRKLKFMGCKEFQLMSWLLITERKVDRLVNTLAPVFVLYVIMDFNDFCSIFDWVSGCV